MLIAGIRVPRELVLADTQVLVHTKLTPDDSSTASWKGNCHTLPSLP